MVFNPEMQVGCDKMPDPFSRQTLIEILNRIDARIKQIEIKIEAGEIELIPARRELDNLWGQLKAQHLDED